MNGKYSLGIESQSLFRVKNLSDSSSDNTSTHKEYPKTNVGETEPCHVRWEVSCCNLTFLFYFLILGTSRRSQSAWSPSWLGPTLQFKKPGGLAQRLPEPVQTYQLQNAGSWTWKPNHIVLQTTRAWISKRKRLDQHYGSASKIPLRSIHVIQRVLRHYN
jgi:hypothetical protein